MPFIGIGIITSIGIEFFKLSKDEFRSYFSSVLIIPIVSFFAVMLVVILSGKYFIGYFDIENVKWLYVLPFLALFSISEELALTLLRNKKEAVPYGVAKTLKVIIEISLTLYLIIELGMKWEGRMLSWGLAALLAGIAPLIYFKKIKIFDFKLIKKKYIMSALAFGIPLIPERISTFVLNISDRLFIAEMESLENVGLYAVGSQVGMVILVLTGALLQSFIPFQYEKMTNLTRINKIKIVQYTYIFMIILIIVFLVLILFTPIIFSVLNKEFISGSVFVFWIALGYLFEALYNIFYQYLIYLNKTRMIAVITLLGVLTNLVLNYLLIKEFGTIGAAYSTLISYALIATITFIIANRIFPMPWLAFSEIVQLKINDKGEV